MTLLTLLLALPIAAIVVAWTLALLGYPDPIENGGRLLMEWGQSRREPVRPIVDEVGEMWAPRRPRTR